MVPDRLPISGSLIEPYLQRQLFPWKAAHRFQGWGLMSLAAGTSLLQDLLLLLIVGMGAGAVCCLLLVSLPLSSHCPPAFPTFPDLPSPSQPSASPNSLPFPFSFFFSFLPSPYISSSSQASSHLVSLQLSINSILSGILQHFWFAGTIFYTCFLVS